jgi:hypothetical protein
MSEQEIVRQNSRGIFTVSPTLLHLSGPAEEQEGQEAGFPRVVRVAGPGHPGEQDPHPRQLCHPACAHDIYLDIEGLPDKNSYYLIGLVVVGNGVQRRLSYWADGEVDQVAIFRKLLEKLGQYSEYALFHFGDYETRALRRIRCRLPGEQQEQVDKVLVRAVNVLLDHPPACLLPDALMQPEGHWPFHRLRLVRSRRLGPSSVAWRMSWERSGAESLKEKLLRYNSEDCLALKAVVDLLTQIAPVGPVGTGGGVATLTSPAVVHTEDLPKAPGRRHQFREEGLQPSGFTNVNQCAYIRPPAGQGLRPDKPQA